MRRGRTVRLVATVALATAALACGQAQAGTLARFSFTPPDALTTSWQTGRMTGSEYALERARSLFALPSVRGRYGFVLRPGPHDATLILRDLVARLPQLSGAERVVAEQVLARPDDGAGDPAGSGYGVPTVDVKVACTTNFCVHWVATTNDAPSQVDTDADTIPDYVETTQETLETIWAKEVVEYGYRPPRPDLTSFNHGPDGKVDVYLADVGADGLYGYCTTDDPGAPSSNGVVSAYCVLDNDFSVSQFGGYGATGIQALQVTAAHEFFHAVQAGYDFFDDATLIEGTAVWMEDEVFDDINDNRQFLAASALARPDVSFDLALRNGSDLAGFQYGSWIFFRFLTETLDDPTVIRRIWELADATQGAPDQYSLEATDSMLRERSMTLREEFASFTAANLVADAIYSEAVDGNYPTPELDRAFMLKPAGTAKGNAALDHLAAAYVGFQAARAVKPTARLQLSLDLPARARGAEATLMTLYRNGTYFASRVKLNANGDARVIVPFGSRKLIGVTLVLTNASASYTCFRNTVFACEGVPRDDDLVFRYAARVV